MCLPPPSRFSPTLPALFAESSRHARGIPRPLSAAIRSNPVRPLPAPIRPWRDPHSLVLPSIVHVDRLTALHWAGPGLATAYMFDRSLPDGGERAYARQTLPQKDGSYDDSALDTNGCAGQTRPGCAVSPELNRAIAHRGISSRWHDAPIDRDRPTRCSVLRILCLSRASL